MGMDRKLEQYEKKIEKLKSEKERAQGTIDHLTDKLKEEFDCDSVEEAETKVEELQDKVEKCEQQVTKSLENFEEEYKDALSQ